MNTSGIIWEQCKVVYQRGAEEEVTAVESGRLEFRFLPATGQLDDLGKLPSPSELLHSRLEKCGYQVGFTRSGVWSLVRSRLLRTRASLVILVRSTSTERLVTLSP